MSEPESAPGESRRREKAWAVVRIALGLAQIMAATVTFVLLVQTGVNEWSMGLTAATGLLVLLSKWLFRDSRGG
jgi:hypothetical protein